MFINEDIELDIEANPKYHIHYRKYVRLHKQNIKGYTVFSILLHKLRYRDPAICIWLSAIKGK